MASSTSSPSTTSSRASKKVLVPKVWKRPHSTIYGKNVEFGSSLYSDKIGEINGRKFNSELPWTLRNSGTTSSSGSYTSQGYLSNQSPVHSLPSGSASGTRASAKSVDAPVTCLEQSLMADKLQESGLSYAQLLDLTNPSRSRSGGGPRARNSSNLSGSSASLLTPKSPSPYGGLSWSPGGMAASGSTSGLGPSSALHVGGGAGPRTKRDRIDFYEQYGHLDKEIHDMTYSSLMMNEPLLCRKTFDNFLDFDPELGLFLSNSSSSNNSRLLHHRTTNDEPSTRMDINTSFVCPMLMHPTTTTITPNNFQYYCDVDKTTTQLEHNLDRENEKPPLFDKQSSSTNNYNQRQQQLRYGTNTTNNIEHNTNQSTDPRDSLPLMKQKFTISGSPYGQSSDGRKLSLGSINPQSYRPSLPQKTTTAHASDGEEIEFHDRSSPFYTDRWAGKTIRHFDSDLYSNANLFKSMIL